jgi:hypothetical protein
MNEHNLKSLHFMPTNMIWAKRAASCSKSGNREETLRSTSVATNAGENRSLQTRANGVDWKLNFTFEYTLRHTPQHNHLAELALASIASKGRAIMSAVNIPQKTRYYVWTKAFQHATDLDGLKVTDIDGKVATRYEHWCGKLPKWVKHHRTWGECGTVKVKNETTPKKADRGISCMFVGYSKDHDGDCYDMWYPKTSKV